MWVRTASEADLPAVHALLAETMQAAYGKILGPISVAGIVSSMHAIDVMRAWLNSPFSEFVVADDGNGSVDGMAFARQLTDDTVQLSHLYVRPSEQVQGLGTALLAEVESAFPGVRYMTLDVIKDQSAAVRFFERKGYVVTGEGCAWKAANCEKPTVSMQKTLETWAF